MEFGLSENVCAIIRAVLARYPVIEQAIMYGSRAKGTYKNGSDIDLTLVGDRLDYQTLVSVASELDNSDIPHTVDLSILAQIENPVLCARIVRVGKVFYQRGSMVDRFRNV
ncbi:MAG: nucleotidyltransferase domain-containing protein [Desulfobulbaceae bacterium]|nr:nucleotidyltransferase domain-containing protein [Desulfobulbaceae bacterium]